PLSMPLPAPPVLACVVLAPVVLAGMVLPAATTLRPPLSSAFALSMGGMTAALTAAAFLGDDGHRNGQSRHAREKHQFTHSKLH
nr:hypothetical protein [Pseudomonadota bacterium]